MTSLKTTERGLSATPGWDLPPEEWIPNLQGMDPPAADACGLPLSELDLQPVETMVVIDIPSLRLVHITPSAEILYGRPLAELCRNPRLMFEAIHPEDAESPSDYMRRLLEHPDGERTVRIRRPDGSAVWVRTRYRVTRDDEGRPLHCYYRQRLLEDREIAQIDTSGASLDTSQLADIVPGFVFELSRDGRVTYANRYAALLTGYRPHHVRQGLTLEELFLPEDLPGIREYVANLLAGREMEPREFRMRSREGQILELYGTATRIVRDDRPVGIRGVLVDVTARNRAERLYRLLEATLNFTHDSVFLLNVRGQIVWVNDTALARLGYAREELVGREASVIADLEEGACARIIESLRHGTRTRIMQGAQKTRDGGRIPMETVLNLVTFEGEEFVSVVSRDISARQKRQREREAVLRRLERQRDAYQQLAGDRVVEHGNWEDVTRHVTRVVAKALAVERVSVWLLDADRERLVCARLHARSGDEPCTDLELPVSTLSRFLDHLGREHVLDVADARHDPRLTELRELYLAQRGIGALLDTALVQDGEVKGLLCCEHVGDRRQWHPDEVSFAVSVASLLMRVRERCARQAVERERALFRTAADRASYGAMVQQLDGTILYVNQARAEIHGYTPEELVGRNIRELFPPEGRALVDNLVNEVCGEGALSGRETWQVKRDGTPVCLMVNAVLIRGEHGAPDVIVSTTVDITELKEHQRALQEERRRLKNYIASLPGFVFRIRNAPDWPVEFISEGCLTITGWKPEDLTENRNVRHVDCVHPEDQAMVWEAMHAAMEAGEPYEVEYRVVHRDGSVRWVWERGYGVYGEGGELVAAEGFVFDITDRVAAEQAIRRLNADLERRVAERTRELQESREKYRLLVESLRDSFIFLSFAPDGQLLYSSPSLLNVLGYTREQLQRIHSRMLEPNERVCGIQRAFAEAVAGRQPEPVEIDVRHANGERRVLEMVLVPVVKNGEVLSIEAVGHDITEHKRNLETIQQAQKQLVESEKMAALGRMVAGMAHEINTPIGIGVTAATHLQHLQDDLATRFREGRLTRGDMERFLADGEEAARMVLANLNKAAQLIQGFKGVAVDQSDEARRRFDMREYLEEILLSLRPALKKTPHQVELDCPADLVVDSRPGALSHVITNLVMNSLIHGFRGLDRPGHIRIAVSAAAGRVTLVYRDDGVGMTPDVMQHIYEPFFTTRRGEGGSGLGMHVVYRAVTESLNGDIACESGPGEGVTFTITFPQQSEVDHE